MSIADDIRKASKASENNPAPTVVVAPVETLKANSSSGV